MALRRDPDGYKSKFQEKHQKVFGALMREHHAISNGGERSTRLFDYQIEALLETNKHFRNCETSPAKPALIVAPAGAGKSGIAVLTPYVLRSKRVLVLTPSPLISTQLAIAFGYKGFEKSFFHQAGLTGTEDDYDDYRVDPFVVRSAEHVEHVRNGNHPLVIVNAQKFGGNSKTSLFHRNVEVVRDVQATFKRFNIILVDEAHHYPARTWRAIVDNFCDKQIVFFTATPYNKGKPILGSNQMITFKVTREQIESTTRRCHFRELKSAGRRMKARSLGEMGREVIKILDGHDKLEPTIKHKALVLVYTKREAELVGEYMESATYYTSGTNSEVNFEGFQGDSYRIMAVCGKCVEGYDNRNISVCMILRNVCSRVLFSQFLGRCLRTSFPRDRVCAMLLSHSFYNQFPMWEQHQGNEIAQEDPEEDPEDDD